MATNCSPDAIPEDLAPIVGREKHIKELTRLASRKTDSFLSAMWVLDQFGGDEWASRLHQEMTSCGSWLLFNHYLDSDEYFLSGVHTCKNPLLCSFCAYRRWRRLIASYLPIYQKILSDFPDSFRYMVTLTVKNGPDLLERFSHLKRSWSLLNHDARNFKARLKKSSCWGGVLGSLALCEVVKGSGSGEWNPHIHAVAVCSSPFNIDSHGRCHELEELWFKKSKDSCIVNVKPFRDSDGELLKSFCEVIKYSLKFSNISMEERFHVYTVLAGRRLLSTTGCFRGVELLESDSDDLPDKGEFDQVMYKYLFMGGGYALDKEKTNLIKERSLNYEKSIAV